MKTSRQRLLEYVQAQRVVTSTDLSRALHMTEANARHHLAILKEQGLVDIVGQRPPKGKGRPAQLYSLTTQSMGHNLDRLAGALMEELKEIIPPDEHQQLWEQAARRMARGFVSGESEERDSPTSRRNLTQRLYLAIQHLNRSHYQARWEAHVDAPRLILGHCPYAAILPKHPELCQIDRNLLEELLKTPVVQSAKLELDSRGLAYCMFLIQQI